MSFKERATLAKSFVFEQKDMVALLAYVIAVFAAILIPLHPKVMDVLLGLNITLSVILLMNVCYLKSPLELSSFPTVLLGITLFRLSLNVATTKLILSGGKDLSRAGDLILGFSQFMTGGGDAASGLIIGFIIFIIFVIIQFVVITKGSGRIAEVSARFTLDAMPGKQMAIDADLNAGLIDENEARNRRETLSSQADFFGAMDGASKFVRGEAIASLIITAINLVLGLVLGLSIHEMSFIDALDGYSLLTIGDGLISQLPALIVSVSSGIIITRGESKNNISRDIFDQLIFKRTSLIAGGVIMLFLAIALQVWTLAMLGVIVFIVAWKFVSETGSSSGDLAGVKGGAVTAGSLPGGAGGASATTGDGAQPEDVSVHLKIDQLELEVGYSLIPLVDSSQGGDLLERITMMRRQLTIDMGLLLNPIRVRDNMQLPPNDYAIKLRNSQISSGMVYPDQFLAMDCGVVTEKIEGIETVEPAFGMPSVWIPESLREQASLNGYTVVDATTVMSTHITEIIKNHASEILSRQMVSEMLDKQKEMTPSIVEEVMDRLRLSEIQAVMKNLLREKVSIRDVEVILEVLGDYAERIKDPEILTEYVRARLGRNICSNLVDDEKRLFCVTLDPSLEEMFQKATRSTDGGSYLAMEPDAIKAICDTSSQQLERLVGAGHHPVILCSAQVRFQVYNTLNATLPNITVLSYNEIVSSIKVESLGLVSKPRGHGV